MKPLPPDIAAIIRDCQWETERIVSRTFPGVPPGMRCLYWTMIGLAMVHRCAAVEKVEVRAGSAQFRCVADKDSNGGATHMSYIWGGIPGQPPTILAKETDKVRAMPEMHCWIWLPDYSVIVDYSACEVPIAGKLAGLPWSYKLPPKVIIGTAEELYPDYLYMANPDATLLAMAMMDKQADMALGRGEEQSLGA